MPFGRAVCQPYDVSPSRERLVACEICAKGLFPSTRHQRNMRSVRAQFATSNASVDRYRNGMPVDPDVSFSVTAPASAGVLALSSLSRFLTASARVKIGISDHRLLISSGELTSNANLSA